MTTANKITIARILLIPFFIVQVLYYEESGNEWHRFWAIASFALAAMADGLDGYIARRYNQRSELGAILDPLADKLLLVSAIIVLSLRFGDHSYFVRLPLWLTTTVIARDVILLIGLGIIHYMLGKVKVRPRMTGKIATVFQMITVGWTMLQWPAVVLPVLSIAAGVFTALSGLLYIYDGVHQLNAHPSSAASPKQ